MVDSTHEHEPGLTYSSDPLAVVLSNMINTGHDFNDIIETVSILRSCFYIETHSDRNNELARIASWQSGIKDQVRAEIELENGSYQGE